MHVSDRTGRPIKLHNLHVLVSVIQAGGMGRAARRLNTSQSAISRSIAELEHAFGVRLLDRSRQGVEPTQYGRVLLGCAAAVFDELRQGAKSIEFLADPTGGEIRVAGNEYIIAGLIATVFNSNTRVSPLMWHLWRSYRSNTARCASERLTSLSDESGNRTRTTSTPKSCSVIASPLWRGWRIRGLAVAKSTCPNSPTNPGLCPRLTRLSECSLPSYSVRAASNLHREAWREARFTWSARWSRAELFWALCPIPFCALAQIFRRSRFCP